VNQRVKALAEQCIRTKYVGIIPRHHGSEVEFDHDKFAGLIVQECKDLLFESSENNRLPMAVDDMFHIINQHFGVK